MNLSGTTSLNNSILSGNQATNTDSNGIYTQTGQVTLSNDGDLNLSDTIAAQQTTSTVSLSGTNINISIPIQSSGGDINIDATQSVTALNADATISSSGDTGGNITITAGSDVQLRNVLAFGTNGDGGNISITSSGGLASTTFGGSEGVLNSSGNNGNAGNIAVNATGTLTLGQLFAEGIGGAGGTVNLASDSLVQITGAGTGGFGITTSISTTGSTAGGNIIVQHGGLGLVPFTVGDASSNGTAGTVSTGTGAGQTLTPTQSFLGNFSQGGIQILTDSDTFSAYSEVTLFPLPGSSPPVLEFYEQSPVELFLELVAEQVDGAITIDETGRIASLEIRDEAAQLDFELLSDNNEILTTLLDAEDGSVDISAIDELLESEYVNGEVGQAVTFASIREIFGIIEQQTGTRPALIYALSTADALEIILVTPQSNEPLIRKVIPEANRNTLFSTIRRFRRSINRISPSYLDPAQQLYDWLIRPIESSINTLNIDTLVFAMGEGLRAIPLAALHDGEQFLIENYSLGQIPSLSLTDSRYVPLQDASVLAMGASEFEQLGPLPAVPGELNWVASLTSGEAYLNQSFTWDNLATQSRERNFEIVHLATHAAFRAGSATNSYIQLWGNDRIGVDELRELRWFENPKVELLVLSACETALGDPHAELGFAGLAVQAGVKTTLASLWQISDAGTMQLMGEFYQQLGDAEIMIKTEALRQAQLVLLRGETTVPEDVGGQSLLPQNSVGAQPDLSHPFYWSVFILVGSPW
ncbi:MAG: CHAT domain-containing protein [Cyanobacteria bacterium P01_G01_bin.54]